MNLVRADLPELNGTAEGRWEGVGGINGRWCRNWVRNSRAFHSVFLGGLRLGCWYQVVQRCTE